MSEGQFQFPPVEEAIQRGEMYAEAWRRHWGPLVDAMCEGTNLTRIEAMYFYQLEAGIRANNAAEDHRRQWAELQEKNRELQDRLLDHMDDVDKGEDWKSS